MKNRQTNNNWLVFLPWVIVLSAGILGAMPLIPPAPTDLPAEDAFSAARALEHIAWIAQEPRPIGSSSNHKVRANIVSQLEQLGLETDIQVFEAPEYYRGTNELVELGNVVARIPGTDPKFAVTLVGHFDTIPGSPGANDDASAVAILLEVARAILAGPRLQNDVMLVFTDGEEPAPRFGSRTFVADHPWASDIGFVINLESIGSGGQSLLSEMNGPRGWLIDRCVEALPYPATYSFLTTTAELIGGSNSDFATFRDLGIAGTEFVYMAGSPIYHTPNDTPQRVSLRSLHQQGANTIALTRHIGNRDTIPTIPDSEAIFFTTAFYNVIQYPASWALPLSFLTGIVLLAAGWRQKAWLRILRSIALTFTFVFGSSLLAIGGWTVLAGQRNAMGVAESYLYLAGLIVLTAGIGYGLAIAARRQTGDGADAIGVVIVWWLLGLLTTIAAPGMSYLFALPALAGSVMLLWRLSTAAGSRWLPVGSAVVISSALLVLTPAIDTFYQIAQPRPGNPDSQILFVIALPVMLIALLIELSRAFWPQPVSRHR